MKNTFTLILFIISSICLGQNQFIYNSNGLNPKHLITEIDNKSKTELYISTIDWIKDNYKNPDNVIKSTIENNKIRFEGINPKSYCENVLGMSNCFDIKYVIEVEFKDGKYKIEPIDLSAGNFPTYFPIKLDKGGSSVDNYYNKSGELKNPFKKIPTEIQNTLNNINKSIEDYILKGKNDTNNSDW